MTQRIVGPVLTPDEVAAYLDCDPKKVWSHIRTGELRVIRLSPRDVRIRPSEVQRWLRTREAQE